MTNTPEFDRIIRNTLYVSNQSGDNNMHYMDGIDYRQPWLQYQTSIQIFRLDVIIENMQGLYILIWKGFDYQMETAPKFWVLMSITVALEL